MTTATKARSKRVGTVGASYRDHYGRVLCVDFASEPNRHRRYEAPPLYCVYCDDFRWNQLGTSDVPSEMQSRLDALADEQGWAVI